jgi:glycosyltransferase involved in cell wall biosynthesis
MRLIYRNTPFLTGSTSSVEELKGLGLQKVHAVPMSYGVEVEQYFPGKRASNPTILYLGRLKQYKGVDHLLSIVPDLRRNFPDLRVEIAGTGDARPALRHQAEKLAISDCVSFHGRVDDEERLRLYQEAWVTCLPSFKEGFGLTIPEAALCETPTVGYDVPGIRDAIVDGKTGRLVPYGDRRALCEAFREILGSDNLRAKLGTQARSHYANFSWENAASQLEGYLLGRIERGENYP